MLANYGSWSRKVEADNWSIATYDKKLDVWYPPDALAHFYGIGNTECDAMVAIRLNGHGNPGSIDCGNGIHPAELLILQNDHNGEVGEGIHFRSLALPIGTCVASYRNPKSSSVLDCARLAQSGMP